MCKSKNTELILKRKTFTHMNCHRVQENMHRSLFTVVLLKERSRGILKEKRLRVEKLIHKKR